MISINSRTVRRALLTSVSAVALFAMVEGEMPGAQAGEPHAVWIKLFGEYNEWDGGKPAAYWPFGGPLSLPNFTLGDGFGVGGELGFRIDEIHTVVARIRYNEMSRVGNSASSYAYYKYYALRGRHKEHAIIGDLEIGRDVGLGLIGAGDGKLRLHAGVRIGHFEAKSDISYSAVGYYVSNIQQDILRQFTGGGPRVGFDASVPLGPWASLDLTGAGAVLFGRHSFDLDGGGFFFFGPPFSFQQNRSDFVVVPNVDASAAFTFKLGDNTSVSLGYRVDAFFNVHDDGGANHDEGDRIIHGPFGSITIALPGGGP
jgi:hypothetical protein